MPKLLNRLILAAHSQAGLLLVTVLVVGNCAWLVLKLHLPKDLIGFALIVIGSQYGAVVHRIGWCAGLVSLVFFFPPLLLLLGLMVDLQEMANGFEPVTMARLGAMGIFQCASCAVIMVIMGLLAYRLNQMAEGLPDPITGEGGCKRGVQSSNYLDRLMLPLAKIADVCGQHRIQNLTMLVYEDFEHGNPTVLLAEFQKQGIPGLEFFLIEQDFAQVLSWPVHLVTPLMDQGQNAGKRLSGQRLLFPVGHRPRPIRILKLILSSAGHVMAFLFPARPSAWTDKPTEPAPRPDLPPEPVAEFCRTHRIRRLLLIDPVWRRSTLADDIDLVVEFEPGHAPGLVFFGLEQELSALVDRRVDLRTPGFLSPRVRDPMLASARVLHEAQ